MRTRSSLIALIAALTLGCEAPEVGDAATQGDAAPATERATVPADAAATEAEVARIRDAWVEAAAGDDAATVASLYAEDARMVGATGDVSDGRDAIREALAPAFEAMSDLEVTSTDLVVGTDVVSDMGTYTQILRTP
ncbi:MAG: nuclear transport factor 2 family protein, partial [Gemmatimonadetes bacterium]|nr:nuclear transport factor 2 family protein [Gemmatimonadota bacterium]